MSPRSQLEKSCSPRRVRWGRCGIIWELDSLGNKMDRIVLIDISE